MAQTILLLILSNSKEHKFGAKIFTRYCVTTFLGVGLFLA